MITPTTEWSSAVPGTASNTPYTYIQWIVENASNIGFLDTFETISLNINSYNKVINYDLDGNIDTIEFDLNPGTITKTFNYLDGNVSTIILSGDTPDIQLTKTFTYTDGNVTSVEYT